MTEVENVKVAVRVRPFNKREKDRKAKNVVSMKGNVTMVCSPEDKEEKKSFTYDHSYWSFDGYKEKSNGYFEPDPNQPRGNNYCDQKKIYNDLGKGILTNAWSGYNATLFAYGQTGSGKSYSIIGYGVNNGIVPLLCEELFVGIRENKEDKQMEVYFSMLEIYNEVVRDLLNKSQKKEGLKIRQHPKTGFYVDGLNKSLVSSHNEILAKMEEGTVQRTVRATNMNATSSRAHTIVGITFIQKFKNSTGEETAKSAVINLVDLAGSERVESTGATGERLKEGAAINMSLTCLGNCIHALVKKSQGESVRIPFRDSALTKLLKNALGGNSKTVMVAAISPADINYSETLSTLHFADRAKQIKTKAIVNEDPTEKLIRELKMQNEILKKQLQSGKIDRDFIDEDGDGIDDRDAAALRRKWEEELKARLAQNSNEMSDMKKSYEEKLKAQKNSPSDNVLKQTDEEKKTKPHITNLNMDPQLNQKICHILKSEATTIGNGKGSKTDLVFVGPSIQPLHARIVQKNKKISVEPVNEDCRVLVNGSLIKGETPLTHNDRLVFGTTQMWVFQHPQEKGSKKMALITYEYAQEEIAAKSGLDINTLSSEEDVSSLQQELLDVVPAVEEANAISADLDKKVKFELELISPKMMGKSSGKTLVQVKMTNLENGTEFHFSKEKFLDRTFKMREMYNNSYEADDDYDLPAAEDPFHESLETEVLIGTASVLLQPIAHNIEIKEQVVISNLQGSELGFLNVEIVPCNKSGKEYTEKDDVFVDNPDDLIGQDFHFVVKIPSARGLPNKYTGIFCTYTIYLDKQDVKTEKISDTINPEFMHKKRFSFKKVTKQFIDYLNKSSLVIQIKGKQKVRGSAIPLNKGLSTRDMLKNDKTVFAKTASLMNGFQMNGRVVDPQRQSIIVELLLMKKTQAKLQQRCDNVAKLIKEAENTSRLRVSTTLLREVMNAGTSDQADALIRKKLSGNI